MPVWRKRNTERSRELRREVSPAERLLWNALSSGKLDGHRFTRQFQVGPFYADIAYRREKLIIEVDGYSHDMRVEQDASRHAFLQRDGYRVMRVTNEDVTKNLEGVVEMIALALGPSPSPSRKREGRTA